MLASECTPSSVLVSTPACARRGELKHNCPVAGTRRNLCKSLFFSGLLLLKEKNYHVVVVSCPCAWSGGGGGGVFIAKWTEPQQSISLSIL